MKSRNSCVKINHGATYQLNIRCGSKWIETTR